MRGGLLLGLLLLGLGGATACMDEANRQDAPGAPDLVARVNGQGISRDLFVRELDLAKRKFRLSKNDPIDPNKILWLKTNTLNQVIQEALLVQEAEKQNISVSEDEFQTFRIQLRQGYQPESLERTLDAMEISASQWDERIRTRLLIKKLIDEVVNSKVKVTEKELKNYFEAHQEDFQKGERIRALHILVSNEEEARQILKWLEQGRDFSELAREYSQSLEGAEGGDMGFLEAGHLPEEFDPVFKLSPGEVSEIIQTPYGYHVFKVVEKEPARQRLFEEAREEIHARLLEQAREKAFQQWLKNIRQQSKVEIFHEVLDQVG